MCVWFYNSGETLTQDQLKNSFSVYKKNFIADSIKAQKVINSSKDNIYQALFKNPIDISYNNIPIALKVKFEKGDCFSTDFIKVTDYSGVELPFQWEGDIHPNYLKKSDYNLESYSDGSLKSGTIWIIDSIEANENKIYTIQIKSSINSNTFSTPFELTYPSTGIKYLSQIVIDKYKFIFTENTNFLLQHIYCNDLKMASIDIVLKPFINYDGIDANTYRWLSNANYWKVKDIKIIQGNIFVDNILNLQLIENKVINAEIHYRIFKSGICKTELYMFTTGATTNVHGCGLYYLPNSQTNDFDVINNGIVSKTDSREKIAFKFVNGNMSVDLIDNSVTFNSEIGYSNKASGANTTFKWQSSDNKSLQNGSLFYINSIISIIDNNVSANDINNIMSNLPSVHATKYNRFTLRKKFKELCKDFIGYALDGTIATNDFPAMVEYIKFANLKLDGKENEYNISTYIGKLTTKYGSTVESIKTWFNNGYGGGIEHLGRDFSDIDIMRKYCLDILDTTNAEILTNLIHAVADFYVWCETWSGGNGMIRLSITMGDTMNSEATAMKGLMMSLSIASNIERQSCYDRIKSRFDSYVQNKTNLPYSYNTNIATGGLFHYNNFSLYEYMIGTNFTPNFDVSAFATQIITSTGKAHELGYTYTPIRFGFTHTYTYLAYILYHYDTISSLQTACIILENVISQCFASGGHKFPLDDWKNINGTTIDQPIEIASALRVLME